MRNNFWAASAALAAIMSVVSWGLDTAAAQDFGGITVSEVAMTSSDEGVKVEMRVEVRPGAVQSTESVEVVPVLTKSGGGAAAGAATKEADKDVRFPGVRINGRNKSRIYKRHSKMRYTEIVNAPPFRVVDLKRKFAGETVDYVVTMDWAALAAGGVIGVFSGNGDDDLADSANDCKLTVELVVSGPAGARHTYTMPVGAAFTQEPSAQNSSGQPVSGRRASSSSGRDNVVEINVFVGGEHHRFDNHGQSDDDNRDRHSHSFGGEARSSGNVRTVSGTAYLEFKAASADILPNHGRNPRELSKLERAFDEVCLNPKARVVAVTITGYSSPDGSFDVNSAFSHRRAEALWQHIKRRYKLNGRVAKIRGVGEDWVGLRAAVEESDLSGREKILEVTDSREAADAKESLLRKMDGGVHWRAMEREFFSWLRKIDYKIEFELDDE